MNLFVFAPQKEVADMILSALRTNGYYQTDFETSVENALKKIKQRSYDIVITQSPEECNNFDLCREVKNLHKTTKVLVISLIYSPHGRENAFISGADEHLEYPATPRELMEILDKLRFKYKAEVGEPLILGDLVLKPESYEVTRAGKRVHLRKKEYQLLEFFMRNKNRVINRHTILEYIWNYDTQAMTNTLDVHISSLRKKIDGDYSKKLLKTIYGAGYKLSDE